MTIAISSRTTSFEDPNVAWVDLTAEERRRRRLSTAVRWVREENNVRVFRSKTFAVKDCGTMVMKAWPKRGQTVDQVARLILDGLL